MNLKTLPLGIIGITIGVAGMIGYSLAPDKLWLVTLAEAIALACLTVFFIVHFETFKAFSTRRSTRMGANSLLLVLFFIGILAIVNFLAARHSVRWDLSENKNFSLAPQTHRVIRGLPRDVKITVFTREKDPGFQAYKERLDSYRQASSKITVEFVDPERQPKVAQTYGVTRTDTAIFESATQTIRVTNPSEAELTGALIRVSKDDKKRILLLEGHGEHSVDDRERTGFSQAKEILTKQGYEVNTLSLLAQSAVPNDTEILAVVGPNKPITGNELDRIHAYVEKGGHLLLMVDPETQADVSSLLSRWGLSFGPGVLVDVGGPEEIPGSVLEPVDRHEHEDEECICQLDPNRDACRLNQ